MSLFRRRRTNVADTSPPLSDPPQAAVPLLVGQAWLDANEQTFGQIPDFPAEARPFIRPLADGLWASYAHDLEGGWQQIQAGQVEAAGGADALHARSLDNLARRVSGRIDVAGEQGRFRLTVPEELDLSASLALVPQLWPGGLELVGAPVVCVPTRAELLACGEQDHETVASLAEFAPALLEEARGKPVSPRLYTLGPHGLVVRS